MKPSISSILSILLLCCSSFAAALEPSVRFERFSISEGLSQNTVKAVIQDAKGYIWIATYDGLNRYDGYEFKSYRKEPDNAYSLSDNQINTLFIDSKEQLWIGTVNGLSRYDHELDRFIRIRHYNEDTPSYDYNNITSIAEDKNGILWIATLAGLKMFDPADGCFEHFNYVAENPDSLSANRVRAVLVDRRNQVWVGTDGGGLDRFDRQTGQFHHWVFDADDDNSLTSNRITSIAEDEQGYLWIGTMNGLNRFSTETFQFKRFYHETDNTNSIAHNVVITITKDEEGRMYFGTLGGVSRLNPATAQFTHWQYDSKNLYSISDNSIWSVYFDRRGILWIGTNLGLNRYKMASHSRFEIFEHLPQNTKSLSHSNVMALYKDNQSRLWVATANAGLNRMDHLADGFRHFRHDSANPYSLADDRVFRIYQDSKARIWIGSMGGLQQYEQSTGRFITLPFDLPLLAPPNSRTVTSIVEVDGGDLFVGLYGSGLLRIDGNTLEIKQHFHTQSDNHIHDNWISSMVYDNDRYLWVAGRFAGLMRIDIFNGSTQRFAHRFDDHDSLSNNAVFSLFQDSQERIWIGTEGGGVNRFDATTGKFIHYRELDGLPNDSIYAILQDNQQYLWFSTNNGLSRMDIDSGQFNNYDVEDGLQSNEFNFNAAFFDKSEGVMYFGGVDGFNRFDPASLQLGKSTSTVVLTDFLLFNQAVDIVSSEHQEDSQFVLNRHIDYVSELELTNQENFFTFNFTALNTIDPDKRRYAYRLQGWDKDWINTSAKNRRATYTNIPAGNYVFEVKSADAQGDWDGQVKRIFVTILPSAWQTWWAYTLYGVLAFAVFGLFGYVRAEHLRAERETTINKQLKQVDKLKDEFLANTSHELRTPLNGIIGLAESMLDGAAGQLPEQAKHNLAMVVSSGKRLSGLVNNILDFSKLNNESIELNRKPLDMHALVDVMLNLCQPLVGDKSLTLHNRVPGNLPAADADEDRISQVLHNLISNAIKFTEAGKVVVSGTLQRDQIEITVTDTGIGVSADKQEAIFKSFNQLSAGNASGAGMGLAVSRALIELHGGELKVDSETENGACFSFTLPSTIKPGQSVQTSTAESGADIPLRVTSTVQPIESHNQQSGTVKPFRILLVDDEPINRQVLLNHLSVKNYQLVEAVGGQQALDIINEQQANNPFDLILLDIMMPRVSGFEVCQRVRQQYTINDLPIIFLTARSQASDMVESFALGANDYLSKPVAKHELLSRVETHLKLLDINRNLEAKVEERTDELQQSNQRNSAISKICTQISATLDLEQLRDTAYHHISQLMDVHTFCIGFVQKEQQRIEFPLVIEGEECLDTFYVQMKEVNRPAVWCVIHKQPLIINDYLKDHEKYFGKTAVPEKPIVGTRVQSLVYWPLMVSDQLIGVLTVQSYKKNAYNEQHLDMISTLASTTAIAVDNANAYREIEQKNRALVDTQQQLIQQEKMASLGTLTAGVAHEINNPTNFVHVSAQNLEVDISKVERFFIDLAGEDADAQILQSFSAQFKPLHEHLTTIQDGTERIKNIVKDLRLFTQLDSEQKQPVNVVDCLESTLHLVKTKYLEIADFVTDYQGEPEIQGYPSQLNQVFMNLIVNACDAIRDCRVQVEPKGLVEIHCAAEGEKVKVIIRDNGCGMTEQTKQKLFEPFYTTKSVGLGTGLGLSISYGIIQKHGGEMQVYSRLDEGSEFVLILPMS